MVAPAVAPVPAAEGRDTLPFARHHAFIIGIDDYQHLSPLKTAVSDARRLAAVLTERQHFLVHPPLLNATGADLRALLRDGLSGVGRDDRVLFYFAGHGVPGDGDDGPAGYLVPADAERTDRKTFLPMADLQQALNALPCRHLLLILDCCFSGAFKWSSQSRAIGSLMPKRIYKQRFDRFIHDPAWQVITSAAYDQKALDVLEGRATGDRGLASSDLAEPHSPFALALFDALAGNADASTDRAGDGVITATEIYAYIRDRVEPATIADGEAKRQTPGFFPLPKHDKGEYIFLHPKHRLNLPEQPPHSPYKGLESFDQADRLLFYGRDRAIRDLQARAETARLLVVSGASGTGKSSVVKAGLLPLLEAAGHRILPVIRPGVEPVPVLEKALAELGAPGGPTAVLLIDQFEELITRCPDQDQRRVFMTKLRAALDDARIHRVIVTVRSDFEPQLAGGELKAAWAEGRCTIPPFSLEELKEVIVMPAIQEVLIFDPPELVDEIVGDVVQAPGALPLLSYALSELYERYRSSGREDRALRKTDYDALGGVMGALRTKADTLYRSLPPDQQDTMRKVMLRMVSVEGDLASRRVPVEDFDYSPEENPRVQTVLERLVEARLIVRGRDYVEPAHDALVRAWKTLHDWIHAAGRDSLILGARLDPEADEFARTGNVDVLWTSNPNLLVAARELKNAGHRFNAKETAFIRRSVARNRRKARIAWAIAAATVLALAALSVWALAERSTAQENARSAQDNAQTAERNAREAETNAREAQAEKNRALRSLFSGLRLNMPTGQPGSVCVHGLCVDAPTGDGDGNAWLSLGDLPADMSLMSETPASRVFAAARQFGQGHVLVYAQDGLTADREIEDGSDNLVFAENALAWLTPVAAREDCADRRPAILLWEGSYVRLQELSQVENFIQARGWTLRVTRPESLDTDLRCAGVLWYLSDWQPPQEFVTRHVPRIEQFVRAGGGLLAGGLGWSYDQQSGPRGGPAVAPYAADQLGQPFGFGFTKDAFQLSEDKPITLLQPK